MVFKTEISQYWSCIQEARACNSWQALQEHCTESDWMKCSWLWFEYDCVILCVRFPNCLFLWSAERGQQGLSPGVWHQRETSATVATTSSHSYKHWNNYKETDFKPCCTVLCNDTGWLFPLTIPHSNIHSTFYIVLPWSLFIAAQTLTYLSLSFTGSCSEKKPTKKYFFKFLFFVCHLQTEHVPVEVFICINQYPCGISFHIFV